MSCAKVRPGCLNFIPEGLFYLSEAGQDWLYSRVVLGGFVATPYLLLNRSAIEMRETAAQSIPVADRAAS